MDLSSNTYLFPTAQATGCLLQLDTGAAFVAAHLMHATVLALQEDNQGNIYSAGLIGGSPTDTIDIAIGPDTVYVPTQSTDGFVVKTDAAMNYQWHSLIGNPTTSQTHGLQLANDGTITCSGFFFHAIDLDPLVPQPLDTTQGFNDGYIVKFSQCGSIAELDTTVCSAIMSPSGAAVWDSTGVFFEKLTGSAGCDSIVLVNMVYNAAQGDTLATACDSIAWYGSVLQQSGTASTTLTTPQGCDSVLTLTATIFNSSVGDTTATACGAFNWNGTTYTSSAQPQHTYMTSNGCDSVVTLHLTINNTVLADTTATACDSLSWYGTTYYATSSPTHQLTGALGCDTLVTLNLSILHSTYFDTAITACDSIVWYGNVLDQSGSVSTMFTNSAGCDSTETLNLTINHSFALDTSVAGCNSYTWNDTTYLESTVDVYQLQTATGCDSTITLHVSIGQPDTAVTVSNDTLSAVATASSYQWLDCTQGFAPLPGATQQVFVAAQNGSYAVEITVDNCLDTSGCFEVVGIGLEELAQSRSIVVFPNPASASITIASSVPWGAPSVRVFDLSGQLVLAPSIGAAGGNSITIPTPAAAGMYCIVIEDREMGSVHIERFVRH